MTLTMAIWMPHFEISRMVGACLIAADNMVDMPLVICGQELPTTRTLPVLLRPKAQQKLPVCQPFDH